MSKSNDHSNIFLEFDKKYAEVDPTCVSADEAGTVAALLLVAEKIECLCDKVNYLSTAIYDSRQKDR